MPELNAWRQKISPRLWRCMELALQAAEGSLPQHQPQARKHLLAAGSLLFCPFVPLWRSGMTMATPQLARAGITWTVQHWQAGEACSHVSLPVQSTPTALHAWDFFFFSTLEWLLGEFNCAATRQEWGASLRNASVWGKQDPRDWWRFTFIRTLILSLLNETSQRAMLKLWTLSWSKK